MTNKQPEALPAIQRFEVVDCIDDKHVPAVIPKPHGPWVRYEDHIAALAGGQATAAQLGVAYAEMPSSVGDYKYGGGLYTEAQMRAFADATHALRVSHGQAPAHAAPRHQARINGDSAAPKLRAMATNYTAGHQWDKLDAQACIRGALEIEALRAARATADSVTAAGGVVEEANCPTCGTREMSIHRVCHNSACKEYGAAATLHEGWKEPTTTQPAPQQEPSCTSVQLAEMVLSDCGHSSNYTPLLNRVAARIDAHVERCLESKKTTQQEAQEPAGWFDDDRVFWHEGKQPAQGSDLYTTPQPSPAAQGDALPREDFAWLVVQEACETEPADEDDPECVRILRRDLKSSVLAAFLRLDAARAAQEGKSCPKE